MTPCQDGIPRPCKRSGISCCAPLSKPPFAVVAGLLLTLFVTAVSAGTLAGSVVDQELGTPVPGVLIRALSLPPPTSAGADRPLEITSQRRSHHSVSDSAGAFGMTLAPGRWRLKAEILGYQSTHLDIDINASEGAATAATLRLRAQALMMDEMVVRARRLGAQEHSAVFVESIRMAEQGTYDVDVSEILDSAVGVDVRRYGGLGSFSAISIRGSTAEQVQIYLDGVPLTRAVGGGVDLGTLPVRGIESIEVYRGAVPGRFGGNSVGGVVHIRTLQALGRPRGRVEVTRGSFGTRQVSGSARNSWRRLQLLGLVDYSASDNDFRFLDDNGTEYNSQDDERTSRVNSDFGSFRLLTKAARPWGDGKLLVHNTFDVSHRGIPGIGNFQSLHTRLDRWRNATELEAFGTLAASGRSTYRLTLHRLVQQGEYKDPQGEVGTGTQHNRERTGSLGLRGEFSALILPPLEGLLTTFAGLRQEKFHSKNLRRPTRSPVSRRHTASLGAEVEVPLIGSRLHLSGGLQLDVLSDRLFGDTASTGGASGQAMANTDWQRGARVGLQWAITERLSFQGHVGRFQRPPSFFELFGDRGAVIGNTDLVSEESRSGDVGLVYRSETPGVFIPFVELASYRNSVDNLIRFVQNSQRVSRPHNIGRALLRGVEFRTQLAPVRSLRVGGNYVYQRAENRSPFSHERGNDLPNAPRHSISGRASLWAPLIRYRLSYESSHFLDRANLRGVPSRTIHNLSGSFLLRTSTELEWEVKNLTDNQLADLWGYPLPGRAYFASIKQDLQALLQPPR